MAISHVAIIGSGLAGARSVMELRARGFEGEITLLGAEGIAPYDRPPLSEEILTRTEPKWLRDEVGADLDSVAVNFCPAERVSGLERSGAGWIIRTADRQIQADAVVAATGAYPRLPAAWVGARVLHSWDDAARLRSDLAAADSLVCIGAGWIGAEVATAAAAAGKSVTVLEAGAAPLNSVLGTEVGKLLTPWYAEAGISLHTGATVASASASSVELANSERLDADLVLAAVGVSPHTAWLEGAGVELSVSGHVWVDSAQATSADRLWAVGDCTIRKSAVHGTVVGGHWDAALNDPARAAAAILGQEIPAEPAPYVFSNQLGRNIALLGTPQRGVRWALRGAVEDGAWSALWFDEAERLIAVFTVDRPRDTIDARRLLASGPVAIDADVAADAGRRLREAKL